MALPEVQIEVFDKGKGPRHTFKTKLQGWEANKLDLETIQSNYRLENVYAFSTLTGRGSKLDYHPKSGLSRVCYSGKPGAVIRLDSDPKTPVTTIILRFLMASVGSLVVLAAICMSLVDDARPTWFPQVQGLFRGGIGWIVAFSVLMISRMTGWPSWPFRRIKACHFARVPTAAAPATAT